MPSNTFVAEYIPHDLLLPKVDAMVTNGGDGAVQRALSMGSTSAPVRRRQGRWVRRDGVAEIAALVDEAVSGGSVRRAVV